MLLLLQGVKCPTNPFVFHSHEVELYLDVRGLASGSLLNLLTLQSESLM